MTWDDDVVIADGVGEEIAGAGWVGEADDLLGAAEVGLRLAAHQLALADEAACQVARDLEDGDGPLCHIPPDADADARLEVGVELVAFNHVERDGTMCKQHFARLGVHRCGVGLKAGYTRQRSYAIHSGC